MISDQLIFKESGQYDKEVIQHLSIVKFGVCSISNLDACVSLIELNLSFNQISTISGLDNLINLKQLNLAYNKIRKIENMRSLVNLNLLDLRSNQIVHLSDLDDLFQLSSLKNLAFRGVDGEDANPICNHASYASFIIGQLPQLQLLDGGLVKVVDAFECLELEINKLKPDPACSEVLIVEPWFSSKDVESTIQNSKVMDSILISEEKISNILSEDSTKLLRKADSILSTN